MNRMNKTEPSSLCQKEKEAEEVYASMSVRERDSVCETDTVGGRGILYMYERHVSYSLCVCVRACVC